MTKFDDYLDRLIGLVDGLSPMRKAAFFAAVGVALLPAYEEFAQKTGWGDYKLLKKVLDDVVLYVAGAQISFDHVLLLDLEALTPHGDDFDAPESTYAQDAVICVDTALRFTIGDNDASASAVEFVLEPLRTAIAMEQLDCLDPGSSPDANSWFDRLPEDPRMANAIAFLESLVNQLADQEVTPLLVRSLGAQGSALLLDVLGA